jgi:two-component sensor histidine kinase
MCFTNELHHLFFAVSEMHFMGSFPYQHVRTGPWWWVQQAYNQVALTVGILLFFQMWFSVSRAHRKRVGVLLVGVIIPMAANVAYILGFKPYGFFDYTPIALGVTVFLFTWGMFSLRLFDIAPLALGTLVDHMPEGIIVADNRVRIVEMNPAARNIFGGDEGGGKGGSDDVPVPGEIRGFIAGGMTGEKEIEWAGRTLNLIFTFLADHRGGKAGTLVEIRDVTLRRKAEQEVKNLLLEKEILLREVHHRIKNNMASVAAMLAMQSRSLGDPSASEALRVAQDRILRMMEIYDKLYMSTNYEQIGLREYLSPLIDQISLSCGPGDNVIDIEKQIDDMPVTAKVSFPLGIIVNELMTNAYKYAFPDGGKGDIRVRVGRKDENEVEIIVADNGAGLPADVDIDHPRGFGLRLVGMMVRQIEGRIELSRAGGTEWRIMFPAAVL